MNLGLAAMALMSMLPIGILQSMAAMERGTWWARSAEFLQTPLMQNLCWLRAPGDILFAIGVGALAWFIIGLKTGWSLEGGQTKTVSLPTPSIAPVLVVPRALAGYVRSKKAS